MSPDYQFNLNVPKKDGKYCITTQKRVTIEAYIETTTKDLDTIEFSFNPSITGFPIKFDYHDWNLKAGMRWDSKCEKEDPAKDTFYYDWEIPEDVPDGEYKLKVTATTVENQSSTKEIIVVIQRGGLIVTISPIYQKFTKPSESLSHTIEIENKGSLPVTTTISMELLRNSSCLSVTKQPESSMVIPGKGKKSTSFTVTSGDKLKPDDDLIHNINVTAEGVLPENITYPNGKKVTDHPEATFGLSVRIKPAIQLFLANQSKSHTIEIENKGSLPATAMISMGLIRNSSCLYLVSSPASSLKIPAKGKASTLFTVKAKDKLIAYDNLIHQITVTSKEVPAEYIIYPEGRNATDKPDTPPETFITSFSKENQKKIITITKLTTILLDCRDNVIGRSTTETRDVKVEPGKASFSWTGTDDITPPDKLIFSYGLITLSAQSVETLFTPQFTAQYTLGTGKLCLLGKGKG